VHAGGRRNKRMDFRRVSRGIGACKEKVIHILFPSRQSPSSFLLIPISIPPASSNRDERGPTHPPSGEHGHRWECTARRSSFRTERLFASARTPWCYEHDGQHGKGDGRVSVCVLGCGWLGDQKATAVFSWPTLTC